MAHFAKIENGIVTQVIVADTKEWCETNLGGQWEQTSYNTYANKHRLDGTPFRYNYAGIGFTFDPNYGPEGAFISPQPFPSWKLSNVTATWKAPVPEPDNGKMYNWDETTTAWVEVVL
jgi:hypothetical protein